MGKPSDAHFLDRIRSHAHEQATERPLSQRRDTSSSQSRPTQPIDASNPVKSAPVIARNDSHKSSSSSRQGIPLQEIVNGKQPASQPASTPDTKEEGNETAALDAPTKPGWPARMKAGSWRFVNHTRNALFRSWINVLLIFVPVGIAVNWVKMDDEIHATVVFSLNAIAIIPLAGLLSHATESVASSMGDTWASLLNVTFGNAVELIIFVIALVKNEISIVQASILGSILANLLLILGMSFLLGGLRFQEQLYNSTVTQMSACLLSLSVSSLLLPTAFHATFNDNDLANSATTKISRGTSVILLLVYVLYLLFQLKSHAYMYESTPQQIIDEESHPGVLADFMDSSSSSDDDDSSSSDSDTSSGSGSHTAKKRIKHLLKGRKRRKSNASSVQTNSVLSGFGSPTEKRSVTELNPTQGSFMELTERRRLDAQQSGSATSGNGGASVMSGDEADTDGEIDRGAPRVRDFSVEPTSPKLSPRMSPVLSPVRFPDPRGKPKSKKKHHKKKLRDDEKNSISEQDEVPTHSIASALQKEVSFVPESDNKTYEGASPQRRPFATRHLSRVVPPLPPVFVAAPKPPPGTGAFTGHPMAMARSGLRRTSSLPDRLNRRESQPNTQSGGPIAAQTELVPGSNMPAINGPDALGKHRTEEEEAHMSRTAAVVLLLISTALVAFCAELLVDAIPVMVASTNVSQAFIGLIVLPIVGNAAEHVTAVTVAAKNKMDLAIGVAVGSSIQIALFVTPFIVLLGWILEKPMSLYFNIFDTVSLFVTVFVVNFLVLDGRSNYLEGALLIAAYIIIAVAAFFYPKTGQQSDIGGAASGAA